MAILEQGYQSATILVIDDDPTSLGVIVEQLKEWDFRVAVARDGESGLKRAGHLQPALILLDVRMPGIDGFETCRRLKANASTRDIPVIFLTAQAETTDIVTGFELGGVDYIAKPFQEKEILARVNTHLALRNAQKAMAEESAARKLAEQAHQAERERFELALKDSPVVIFTQDTNLRYTWIYNPHPGFDPQTVLGKTDAEMLPAADAAHLMEIKRRVLETGQSAREEVHTTIDNQSFHYDLSVDPLHNETGQIVGVRCATVDVTETVLTKEARQASEAKYRLLFENANAGIILFDTNGVYQVLNRHIAAVLGGVPEDFIGKSIREVFPEQADFHLQRFAQIIREKKGAIFEDAFPMPPGGVRWYSSSLQPVIDPNGNVTGIQIVAVDITERKQAEETLRESEAHYRQLLTTIDVGVVIHGSDRKIMFNNPAANIMLGLNEMVGKDDKDPTFLHEDGSVMPVEEYPVNKVIATGRPLSQYVVGILNGQDSGPTWVLVNAYPEFAKTNELQQVVVTFTNITVHKQSEQALSKSEAALRKAQEIARLGNWSLDFRNGHIDWSDEMYRILGFEKGTTPTVEAVRQRIVAEDRPVYDQAFQKLEKGNILPSIEYRLQRPDGQICHLISRAEMIVDEFGETTHLVGTIQDVTEQKQAEITVRERERLLRQIAANYPNSYVSVVEKDMTIGLTGGEEFIKLNLDPEQFVGLTLEQVFGDNAPVVKEQYQKTFAGQPTEFELQTNNQHQLYQTVPLPDEDGNINRILAVVRNETERKELFERITHLNAVLRAIRNVNQLIVVEKDPQRLIEQASRMLTETRGYHHAWIALLDQDQAVTAVAEPGVLPDFSLFDEHIQQGKRLFCMQQALVQPEIVVIKDPQTECIGCPLADHFTDNGDLSIRLEHDGIIYGVMTVVAPRSHIIDEEEQGLFKEVANDIALALHSIRLEEQRRLAEEALQKREAELRLVMNNTRDMIFAIDQNYQLITANTAFKEATLSAGGIPIEAGQTVLADEYPPEFRAMWQDYYDRALNGEIVKVETSLQWADGPHTIENTITPLRLDDDRIVGAVVLSRDITERIQAEEKLFRNSQLIESINHALSLYLATPNQEELFRSLLRILLKVSDSQIGFLDEVRRDPDGTAYKVNLAISDISWDDHSRHLYEQLRSRNLEFRNLDNLAGYPAKTGKILITNKAAEDRRSGGLPTGHPTLRNFMGLPAYFGGELIGVIGIANRAEDYSEKLAEFLQPLVNALGAVIHTIRRDQKEQEQQQRIIESEKNFRQVTNTMQETVSVITPAGDFLFANNNAAQNFSVTGPEMVIGKNIHDFVPEDQAKELVKQYQRAYQTQEPLIQEIRVTMNSEERWFRNTMKPIEYGVAKTPAILLVSLDITDRKQTEEELRQLNQAMEQSPVSVMITDTEGVIQYVNPKFCQVTGYSVGEVIGQNPSILQSGKNPPEFYREMWETLVAGHEWQGEFHNKKKNGQLFWELASIAGVKNKSGNITHYVAVKEDVTQRKQLEEETVRQERLAAVGQLAAGIAHDFNNLLTTIIGNAELIRYRPDIGEEVKSDLTKITKQGERAAKLTRQLLDFSRQTTSESQPLDLRTYLNETLKFIERTIPENIRIRLDYGRGNCTINGDPTQLQQVITNLAVNARDAMPNGGVLSFDLSRITLSRSEQPPCPEMEGSNWVRLTVTDTGSGIEPHVLPHIFEPFFTTKEVGQGTGLGLAQIYGIVEQHHGCITAESQVGKGATFTLYFPALTTQTSPEDEAVGHLPRGQGETILLVEDNRDVLDVARLMLESLNYRVLTATDGVEGLAVYRTQAHQIALVLTDAMMPNMDGLALVSTLHAESPEIKVLLMSGYAHNPEISHEIAKNIISRLQKPLNIQELAWTLDNALRKR